MLNKEICIKCRNATKIKWGEQDDKLWARSILFCIDMFYWYIEEVPFECPYALEHLMKDQNVK